jgi:hypothetical protein
MTETIPNKDAILPDDRPHVPHGNHLLVEPIREIAITSTSSYSPMLDLTAMQEADQRMLKLIAEDPAPFQRMIDGQK